jgi:cyclin-dependent kinase-like
VLKARHKETGQIVAIKKFKESDEDEQVRKTALREVRILKVRGHPGRTACAPARGTSPLCGLGYARGARSSSTPARPAAVQTHVHPRPSPLRCSHHALSCRHTRLDPPLRAGALLASCSQQLKHDNIVNLIEVFRKKSKLHLVFEYVERTILEDLERNPDGMDPIETKKCLWQLLRSIDYCHAHNIIHRDIKPENLLISRNGILKLCDFGFARTLAGPGARYTDYVATRWYRGPELLTGDTQYGKPVDIWAIGCMLPEMASGAPLFPGESDIDQLFHIMRCFGQLPDKLMDVFRANPLFIGIKIPDNIPQTETLEERFPQYPQEQLAMMKSCLRYEPEGRCTCEELMNHRYFTDDGFVEWFDEELKQMLERDAADFKMRQKKFRKAKSTRGGAGANVENGDSRPQSQPPADAGRAETGLGALKPSKGGGGGGGLGPPIHQQQGLRENVEPRTISLAPPESSSTSSSYHAAANDMGMGHFMSQRDDDGAGMGHLAPMGGPTARDEVAAERRPATRGSECGAGGGGSADYAGDETPLLPNLQRPSTPRAQRLVAFPQLASAVDDTVPSSQSMMPQMGNTRGALGRNWNADASSHGGLSGLGTLGHSNLGHSSVSHGGMGGQGSSLAGVGKGKGRMAGDEVPSMPALGTAMAPAANREGGGSNLPQLREGQVFAAELPERSHGVGGGSLAHAPVPASRGGGGGGKKKASAYDPSNPYFSKPASKTKKVSIVKGSSSSSSSSHGLAGQAVSGSSTSQGMGIMGQAHSIAGLAAAYALPPSALPPSIPPRTPNHEYEFGPPRTPGDGGGGSGLQGLEPAHQFMGGAAASSQQPYNNKLPASSQYNYAGGQYAKYGKRYVAG